jgi:hypothetical protein
MPRKTSGPDEWIANGCLTPQGRATDFAHSYEEDNAAAARLG